MKKIILIVGIAILIGCASCDNKFRGSRFKSKNPEYVIEQGFFNGDHWTWVWYSGEIIISFREDPDSLNCETILSNKEKAEKWINEMSQCAKTDKE